MANPQIFHRDDLFVSFAERQFINMEHDKNQLIKLVNNMNHDDVEILKEAADLISSGVDTLKYDRNKRKITATRITPNGNVERLSRHYSCGGKFTLASQSNYENKTARDDEIRQLYKTKHYTQAELSEIFGLSQPRIHSILKDK